VALVKRAASRSISPHPARRQRHYDLLAAREASVCFQLESAGMRRALLDMRPDRFEDIIALVGALSSGPDGEHPDLLRAQALMEQPIYPSQLEPILRETFGRHRLSGAG